jgi:hypothetical protein
VRGALERSHGLKLAQLLGLLDEFTPGFEIIEPLRAKR